MSTIDPRDAVTTLASGVINYPEATPRLTHRVLKLVAESRDPRQAAADAVDLLAEAIPPETVCEWASMPPRSAGRAAVPVTVSG